MGDRWFYPLMALIMAGMIALSLVWPQGFGQRSPGPFGHARLSVAAPAKSPTTAHAPKMRPPDGRDQTTRAASRTAPAI